jgi:hypothetical protein
MKNEEAAQSHIKATYKPHACNLRAGCMRDMLVFRSHLARVSLVFSSCSTVVPSAMPGRIRRAHAWV